MSYEVRMSNWSSDVCSSDLVRISGHAHLRAAAGGAESVRVPRRRRARHELRPPGGRQYRLVPAPATDQRHDAPLHQLRRFVADSPCSDHGNGDCPHPALTSVVEGNGLSVRVGLGGVRSIIQTTNLYHLMINPLHTYTH